MALPIILNTESGEQDKFEMFAAIPKVNSCASISALGGSLIIDPGTFSQASSVFSNPACLPSLLQSRVGQANEHQGVWKSQILRGGDEKCLAGVKPGAAQPCAQYLNADLVERTRVLVSKALRAAIKSENITHLTFVIRQAGMAAFQCEDLKVATSCLSTKKRKEAAQQILKELSRVGCRKCSSPFAQGVQWIICFDCGFKWRGPEWQG